MLAHKPQQVPTIKTSGALPLERSLAEWGIRVLARVLMLHNADANDAPKANS